MTRPGKVNQYFAASKKLWCCRVQILYCVVGAFQASTMQTQSLASARYDNSHWPVSVNCGGRLAHPGDHSFPARLQCLYATCYLHSTVLSQTQRHGGAETIQLEGGWRKRFSVRIGVFCGHVQGVDWHSQSGRTAPSHNWASGFLTALAWKHCTLHHDSFGWLGEWFLSMHLKEREFIIDHCCGCF